MKVVRGTAVTIFKEGSVLQAVVVQAHDVKTSNTCAYIASTVVNNGNVARSPVPALIAWCTKPLLVFPFALKLPLRRIAFLHMLACLGMKCDVLQCRYWLVVLSRGPRTLGSVMLSHTLF